ncbi:AbfB domain-containing protein [Methylobacterium sp. JK268]
MKHNASRARSRVGRERLLLFTILAGGPTAFPAAAAQFPLVVNQVQDPAFANLAIPDSAPATGMWSSVQPWPINALSTALLPNGKLATWGTPVNAPGTQDGRTIDVWDPYQGFGGGHVTLQGVTGINSFCGTQALQPDGSLMIAGGIFDSGTDKGSAVVNAAGTGISALGSANGQAKLANDRYYSTLITLADGQKLILGGVYPYADGWSDPQGTINNGRITGMTPEIYNWQTGWRSLFGANSRDAFGPDNNRYWYPRAWVAPSGKVFGISSDTMWTLDPSGNGAVTATPFRSAQRAANTPADAPNVGPNSTAVMYDTGKILQVGGNSYDNGTGFTASSRATVIDINGPNPVATDVASMNSGRSWATATVLPTGIVAVTGGSTADDQADGNAVLAMEFWNPASGRWTLGPSEAIYRGYHSTATLMQNGTVLVAGGGAPGPVSNQNAEVYYPPYLFTRVNGRAALAPRPQIVSLAAGWVAHAQSLQFEVSSQAGIAQVVMIGLTAGTHSFNSGQRRYVASFTQNGTVVTMQAPGSQAVAPPGYYQLVAIDGNGVPSPGVIVAVGYGITPNAQPQAPAAPAGAQAANGGGSGAGSGTTTGGGTSTAAGGATATGTPISLQSSNYTGSYLTNVNGTARLMAPGSASDRQQASFRLVAGLAGQGVSFASSTASGQYLRHQNFQVWQQTNDNSDYFKKDATFKQIGSLTGNCGCNTGTCSSYEAINWPGYYLRHRNFQFYITQSDGSDLFKQDASFCAVPALDGATAWPAQTALPQQIGSATSRVASPQDGSIVVINSDNKTIWQKLNGGDFTQLSGNALDVAAVNASSIYIVGTDSIIRRYDPTNRSWPSVGGDARTVAAAPDGTVVVTNHNDEIWVKRADNFASDWYQVPGKAKRVAAMNRGSLWAIGMDNNVYRIDQNNQWVMVGHNVIDIAASADGGVMVISGDQSMWRKIGDTTAEQWTNVVSDWRARAVAIPNAQRMVIVGLDNALYRW